MNGFYSLDELQQIGFKKIGKDVFVSRKASIYSANKISLGNHVRVDDFCILSGNITIGNYVHISAYTALYGKGEIVIGNYCGCSPRCTLLSATDDFSGEYMISPLVPAEFTNVQIGKIVLCNYAQLGANTVVLPNTTIGEGAVTGSLTFVNRSLEPWSINIGIPCRKLKERKKEVKKLSAKMGDYDEQI